MSYVHAAGHRLEYKRLRPHDAAARRDLDEAPVLVFLHEGLGSTALWKDFPQLVADSTGCSALVYSRHGYGKSDPLTRPRAVDYMHEEALQTLPQVLASLAIREPVLIGHSDGASIALIHAGARRWPVRGLVAMAPHVFIEEITLESIAQAKLTFETTDLAVKLKRYHNDPASAFRGWNEIWLNPDFRAWNIEEYLPNIEAPLLLIQGEDDRYGTLAQIRAIARAARGPVRELILPRCGHSPHVDRKQETLEAIRDFVAEVKVQR
ncbi:MAG TPA: alpha/beta hydrolase [Burkholderiales bacterium]|nr:alpha/beta hydrolase [Burkholderiales bacterium]